MQVNQDVCMNEFGSKRPDKLNQTNLLEMSQTTIAPHTQSAYVTRQLTADVEVIVDKAKAAQKSWRKVPVEQRIAIGLRFVVSYLHL